MDKKEFCKDDPVGEFERDKGTDSGGKIRQLILKDGGEDSASVTTHYYSDAGKLLFIFKTNNDVHGNSSEDRVYFDPAGQPIWEVFREASDPVNNNPDVSTAPFELPASPFEIAPGLSDPGKVFDGPADCG
jgi:hypothetical protein